MHLDELSPTPALRQVRGSEKIADALRDVHFPVTKNELIAKLGSATIDFGDTKAPLSEIVRGIPQARFQSVVEAHREVNTRWLRISKALAAVEALEKSEK